MLAGLGALIVAAAFTGAALYINLAEHPARMTIPAECAVRQWRPSYRRGFAMQATLAVAGGALAIWQWFETGGAGWLAGCLLMLANWPFTLLAIMPVNRTLETPGMEARPEAADLLRRWNRLHAVRSALGVMATIVLLTATAGMT